MEGFVSKTTNPPTKSHDELKDNSIVVLQSAPFQHKFIILPSKLTTCRAHICRIHSYPMWKLHSNTCKDKLGSLLWYSSLQKYVIYQWITQIYYYYYVNYPWRIYPSSIKERTPLAVSMEVLKHNRSRFQCFQVQPTLLGKVGLHDTPNLTPSIRNDTN